MHRKRGRANHGMGDVALRKEGRDTTEERHGPSPSCDKDDVRPARRDLRNATRASEVVVPRAAA
jgi:hypothetical protein